LSAGVVQVAMVVAQVAVQVVIKPPQMRLLSQSQQVKHTQSLLDQVVLALLLGNHMPLVEAETHRNLHQ
jgi:hypothetical protein